MVLQFNDSDSIENMKKEIFPGYYHKILMDAEPRHEIRQKYTKY